MSKLLTTCRYCKRPFTEKEMQAKHDKINAARKLWRVGRKLKLSTPEEKHMLHGLRKSGFSIRALAVKLKVSTRTIQKALK